MVRTILLDERLKPIHCHSNNGFFMVWALDIYTSVYTCISPDRSNKSGACLKTKGGGGGFDRR